jgi:hypothetical protein
MLTVTPKDEINAEETAARVIDIAGLSLTFET